MTTQVAETLRAARAKIATPETWTQGAYARDKNGVWVSEASAHATCFCATGAIMAVSDGFNRTHAIGEIAKKVNGSIVFWNDNRCRTHAEVLAAFDVVIAAEEAAP